MHKRKRITEIENIGFISTRIAGTDGVSLETKKWAEVLEAMGYTCFYFAGELDTPEERSMLCPKAHFTHPNEILNSVPPVLFSSIVPLSWSVKMFTKCTPRDLASLISKSSGKPIPLSPTISSSSFLLFR